jgi:hypothetical protein
MNLTAIPFWLKIVGPIVLLLAVFGGIKAWGNSKYNAGEKAGIEATDAKWEAASAKLKEDAAKSATKADDKAAERLAEHVEEITADQEAVNEAVREGRSPLDALFGADGR